MIRDLEGAFLSIKSCVRLMSRWVHKSVEPWHGKNVFLFLGFLLVRNGVVVVDVVVIVGFPPQTPLV